MNICLIILIVLHFLVIITSIIEKNSRVEILRDIVLTVISITLVLGAVGVYPWQ